MTKKYRAGRDIDLDIETVLDRKGRRITEQQARQLAEDALRHIRAGRPSLTSPGERSPVVKARVPADLRDRLRDEAKRRGTTTSDLVRQALEEYLASSSPSSSRAPGASARLVARPRWRG